LKASCHEKTWKQYNPSLLKWKLFCDSNNVTYLKPSIENILQFRTDQYNAGMSYSSINTTRSAIALLIGSVDGHPVGSHPLVCRLFKGIGRLRPPTPKYEYAWDPSTLLSMFQSWKDNEELSIKLLTLKTVSLLALCSAQRAQTLSVINVHECHFGKTDLQIVVTERLKTSKPGEILRMKFDQFRIRKLCLVRCIKVYIERTKANRNTSKLFISVKSPYNPVSSQTISHWLKNTLSLANVDTSMYKGHSFRHSSTSKASSLGVSIDNIYKSAGWSSKSKVFARFYKRPLLTENNFMKNVLRLT